MRNNDGQQSGTWATVVKAARVLLGLSQQALADEVGVDRTTVWRWENKNQRPDTLEITERVIARLRLDRDAALLATGYMMRDPSAPVAPPPDPRLRGLDPSDPVVAHIMGLDVDEEMRGYMLDRRRQLVALRREQDLKEVEIIVRRDRERGAA